MARRNLSERARRRGRGLAAAGLLAALALAACRGEVPPDHYDTDADLSRDDYREGLAAKPSPRPGPAPPIPEPAPIVDLPDLDIPQGDQRVSLTVNEDVPLKEVLIQLAREVGVDLELDPRIEGGIIFSAQQRPFEEVIARIADLAGLRYRFRDGVLRIEFDNPYHINYPIDFPSLARTANSTVSSTGSVRSSETDEAGSNVSSSSNVDIWEDLTNNIEQIMRNTRRSRALVRFPEDEPMSAQVQPQQSAEAQAQAYGTGTEEQGQQSGVSALLQALQTQQANQQQAQRRQQVPSQQVAPRQQPSQENGEKVTSKFSINKSAGILSVYGTDRQHRAIQDYLDKMRRSVRSQVLIEAKVLNVQLNEEFSFGINWEALFEGASIAGTFVNPIGLAGSLLRLDTGGEDLSAVAQLIERFGTVRALSSPRLTVLQNQTAILKVAQEDVFFEIDVERIEEDNQNQDDDEDVVVTSNIRNVTIGFVMSVQPFINSDTEEITMTLRPTLTRVVDVESDPAVVIEGARAGVAVQSDVPVVAVQEMDSVVTMRSGQVLVMGGLMEDRADIDDTGVPYLSEVPILGNLFKAQGRAIQKEELVVLLRATIVEGRGYDAYDAELYNRFGRDRRPFRMEQ